MSSSKGKKKRGHTSRSESHNSFVKNVTSRMSGLLPSTITKWFSSSSSSSANGSAPVVDITDSSSDEESPDNPPSKRRKIITEESPFSSTKLTANASTNTPLSEETPDLSTSVLYNSIKSTKDVPRHEPKYISTPFSTAKNLRACAKPSALKEQKMPSFNPSLLGSPFYSGRTMYGGASSSIYINQPNITQRKIAQVNKSKNNETVNMSHSARQVMDLLETLTSPLVEARRIPVISSNPNARYSNRLNTTLPSASGNMMNKTQELYAPSIASILQLKQRSRLMDTTKVARQIIASHSSTLSNFQPYTSENSQENKDKNPNLLETEPAQNDITPKVKTRLTRRNKGDIVNIPKLPEPELPTAALQIDKDKLPKFSTIFTQTPSEPINTLEKYSKATQSTEKSLDNNLFIFSNPVKIDLDSEPGDISLPEYKFGSPECRIDNVTVSPIKYASLPVTPLTEEKNNESQTATEIDWKCPCCWVSNKSSAQKCVCCGAKPSTKDVNETKAISNSNATPLTAAKSSDNWNCPDCWVSNTKSNDKCVCCGGQNPTKKTAPSIAKTTESNINDWKCEDCWITNKSSVDKCAACGGAKPGTKSTAPSLPVNSFASNVSKEIPKDQDEDKRWECQTCLVTNSSEKSSCICCGADKSSANNEAAKTLFNFSKDTNVSFKFGIDPKLQEEALKNSEVTKQTCTKTVEESETNNNIVSKVQPSSFTLTSPTIVSKSEDKIEGKTPTFTFGIPQSNFSLAACPTFTIKQPESLSKPQATDVEKEKPQEVPKIDFKQPPEDSAKPFKGFGASSITFGMFSNPNFDKEQKATQLISSAPTLTQVDEPPKQSAFTFSAGLQISATPASLFGVPLSTTAPASAIMQTPATTTSAPSLSLFQKPEVTTPTLSIFQNNEPNPATTTSTATLDKPKFNFTFGSSNSSDNQNTSIFKSPFPAATDNNSNKFALATSNSLGSALGNNGLSAGNVLLGGNSLGGNGFGGGNNNMSGSMLGNGSGSDNSMSTATVFGSSIQKDTWPNNNNTSNNIFGSSSASNSMSKPTPFTFGTPSPFNAGNTTATPQPATNIFASNPQPTQNVFGMISQNNTQPSLFQPPSQPQSQPTPLFGSQNPTPALFGAPAAQTPGFGATSQPMASSGFDNPSMTPSPTPAFNFGQQQQQAPTVFGFGQAITPSPLQNAGVYNFGGGSTGSPQQLQFSMGSAPNTTARRMRKAVRRTLQR